MRIFWSFIALLVLATGALFMLPPRSGGETNTVAINAEVGPAEPEGERPAPIETSDLAIDDQATTPDDGEREDATPMPEARPGAATESAVAPDTEAPATESSPAPLEPHPGAADEDDSASTHDQPQPADPDFESLTPEMTTPVATESQPDPAPVEAGTDTPDPAGADAPMINDRFEVKGKGTREDPYQVTWEHLTSAYETYRPKEDKTEIPEHIAMLHDTYVRITGYLAFPMLEGEVDEALVMLNQWDGCCLGVPPSPYDSIEVKMEVTMFAERGPSTPFGAVTGKIRIDPYLVNGWLVGLYIMEEASIETVM